MADKEQNYQQKQHARYDKAGTIGWNCKDHMVEK